jgi:hypothetical protein
MIRRAGRIEPGSGGAVFTGQSGLVSPALIAFTRARLSFFVRPLTDGTVIGGALATESLPAVDGVLEAALDSEGVEVGIGVVAGVDEAPWLMPWAEAVGSVPLGGRPSAPGAARPSLLAAQARELIRANEMSTGIDDDLRKTYCISSTVGLVMAGGIYGLGNS